VGFLFLELSKHGLRKEQKQKDQMSEPNWE
jgi:hypothetical protein